MFLTFQIPELCSFSLESSDECDIVEQEFKNDDKKIWNLHSLLLSCQLTIYAAYGLWLSFPISWFCIWLKEGYLTERGNKEQNIRREQKYCISSRLYDKEEPCDMATAKKSPHGGLSAPLVLRNDFWLVEE